ncbi:MAG: hypothetical protein O3B22_09840 [Proteobacteria bacterium]|nr:hypothetical protein [Pseudomonadota bacterium]
MLCAALLLAACSGETRDEVPAAVAAPVADGQDDHGPYQGLESFTVEGAAVASYRYAAPVGPERRIYAFCVTPAGGATYAILLGSHDETTRIAREMVAIGAGERIYHLDRYDAASGTTLALFGQQPAYDTVRALVVEAVAGRPVETAVALPLGVALAHTMMAVYAAPAAAQSGGPCAAKRS